MSKKIASECDVLNKILEQTKIKGECFEYTGHKSKDGYGVVKIGGRNGKSFMVHRFIYKKLVGKIPKKMLVCHHCDNPSCYNIYHLFLGTHIQNMQDMASKNRAFRSIGRLSGMCKLSFNQVKSIRLDKRPYSLIVKDYKISKSTVSAIKNKKSRKEC